MQNLDGAVVAEYLEELALLRRSRGAHVYFGSWIFLEAGASALPESMVRGSFSG